MPSSQNTPRTESSALVDCWVGSNYHSHALPFSAGRRRIWKRCSTEMCNLSSAAAVGYTAIPRCRTHYIYAVFVKDVLDNFHVGQKPHEYELIDLFVEIWATMRPHHINFGKWWTVVLYRRIAVFTATVSGENADVIFWLWSIFEYWIQNETCRSLSFVPSSLCNEFMASANLHLDILRSSFWLLFSIIRLSW